MRLFHCAPLLAAIPGIAFAGPLTIDAARSALPDPTLAFGVESFTISGPLAFEPNRNDFTMVRVGVSQDIPDLAKRHALQGRADSDTKAAVADTAFEGQVSQLDRVLFSRRFDAASGRRVSVGRHHSAYINPVGGRVADLIPEAMV